MKKNLVVFATSLILVLLIVLTSQNSKAGTLQSGIVPFAMSGSTRLKDGTVLVIKLDWTHGTQVWRSTNQGASWTYASTLPGSMPTGMEKMFCTSKDTVLAVDGSCGNKGHIYRSTNKGVSWTVTYVFQSTQECAWNLCEDSNGRIYVSVYSTPDESLGHAKLLRSTNDGVSWTQIAYWPSYRHCHEVYVNKFNGYVYVALGDRQRALMRSKDNGVTWTNLDSSRHLLTSLCSKGDSNTVYAGSDDYESNGIYRFKDSGGSSISYELVFRTSGYVWFLQAANAKLVFGTACSKAGTHVVLGVSDAAWNSFSIVVDKTSTKAWQSFWPCTKSYWNITKIFVRDVDWSGLAYEPSAPPPLITVTITLQPFNMTLHYRLNSGDSYTAPPRITLSQRTWSFSKWSDGVLSQTRTFQNSGNYSIVYT